MAYSGVFATCGVGTGEIMGLTTMTSGRLVELSSLDYLQDHRLSGGAAAPAPLAAAAAAESAYTGTDELIGAVVRVLAFE